MRISLSLLYTVLGAIISLSSIFLIKIFFENNYIALREIIVFSSVLGVLLPLGLDSAHFSLKDNKAIYAIIFWLSVILILSSFFFYFFKFFFFIIFSILISLSISYSSIYRFISLDLFYLFNNVIFKIFQLLLLILGYFYPIIFIVVINLFSFFIIFKTFKYYKDLTFSFFLIGLQGFVISQFMRLPYIDHFWEIKDYFIYDVFISLSGLLWSFNLIFDKNYENAFSVSSKKLFQYFVLSLKFQFFTLLFLFLIVFEFSGTDWFSFNSFFLVFFLSILNSLPPVLKYSNFTEVLVFFIFLLIIHLIFIFLFNSYYGLTVFIVSVSLYFLYFLYFTRFRLLKWF